MLVTAAAIACTLCTPSERLVINELAKTGITDKSAVAVILGNIKQESNFQPLACEGYTPRLATNYWDCYNNTRGGFGILQWTSTGRIKGLNTFCVNHSCDPNTLSGQMRYLVNEYDFVRVKSVFQTSGLPIQQYKDASYAWIRWGVTGPRWHYTSNYLKKFNEVSS